MVFREVWQKHIGTCEEMKLYEILDVEMKALQEKILANNDR